tara:strand:- start:146 stop:694 length:549 start_codon:yes stop_codon:yes gene_type:complete
MKKMTKFAIAFGFGGKFLKDIINFQRKLKKYKINFMIEDHILPHLTIIAGNTNYDNQKKIFTYLKKNSLKKFKILSPGLGIFANKYPNLHIRWEYNKQLLKTSEKIVKNISRYFSKIKTASTSSLWVPKSTLAWKDLKYTQLNKIFLSNKHIFKSRACTIDKIYLIDFTNNREKLTYKIILK